MCGVIGIVSREPVAERLYVGTRGMLNRGPQSTRIVTYDDKERLFYEHGDLGCAKEVFKDYKLGTLRGCMGNAHTRYATAGRSSPEMLLRNMQPVLDDGMSLCANGDLVNYGSMRQRLEERGHSFNTEVDAKVIQFALMDQLKYKGLHTAKSEEEYAETLFASLDNLHQELIGAYATSVILPRGMLAFKDPAGIRPLCLAHRKKGGAIVEYAVASESGVFNDLWDYDDVAELRAGEAIFVDKNSLRIHRRLVKPQQERLCHFEVMYFARPDSQFYGRRVEVERKKLGRMLGQEYQHMAERLDLITGVPDTGIASALGLSEVLGVQFARAIQRRPNAPRAFLQTSQEEREKAHDEKFMYIKDHIAGMRIGVVDDSNVRGTTAKRHTKRLHALGVKEVHYFFHTPHIDYSCYYGIDTPDRSELIAPDRTNEEIAKIIGVDSVNYISTAGLIKTLGIPANRLCMACLTGEYPTPIDEAQERAKLRCEERAATCGKQS